MGEENEVFVLAISPLARGGEMDRIEALDREWHRLRSHRDDIAVEFDEFNALDEGEEPIHRRADHFAPKLRCYALTINGAMALDEEQDAGNRCLHAVPLGKLAIFVEDEA